MYGADLPWHESIPLKDFHFIVIASITISMSVTDPGVF